MNEDIFQEDWRTRLTTADGSSLELDPDLLEDAQDEVDLKRTRKDEDEDVSGEEYAPWDDLGKTPPRTFMARHRKWNTDKKNTRELDRKVTRGWIRRDGGRSRGGGGVKESPKARSRKLKEDSVQKRSSYRDILREEEREEEQNGGVRGRREEEREEEDELGRTRSSTMSLGPSGSSLYPSLRHADSLPLGYRVKTTSRFMSLSSRPVPVIAHSQSLASSGTQTPRKRSVCDGQDRQTFYRVLTALVKSQTKKEKQSYEHPEGFDRQPSKEETLWQNEIKEVIWLELQAWFAGRTLADQDKWLISEREKVDDLANLVSSFRFSGGGEVLSRRSSSCAVLKNFGIGFEHQTSSSNTGVGFEHQTSSSNSGIGFEHQTSSSSSASVQDIFYDALDTVTRHSTDTGISGQNLEAALSKLGLSSSSTTSGLTSNSSIGTLKDYSFSVDTVDGISMSLPEQTKIHLDEYCDSLVVTCQHRIQNTNLAIQQVENILSKLENCEFLFPSSRQLVLANPSWGDQAFQTRVKVLCMWFNLTIQLNKKIEILGQILIGISSRHKLSIPWPDLSFKPETLEEPASGEQTSCGDIPDVIPAPAPSSILTPSPAPASSSTPTSNQLHPSPVKVRFKMCNEVITSSPSDSNNSTDSGAGSLTDIKLQALRQDSAISTQSGLSNSSHMSDSYLGEISPYRRYVEKLLKTRGIRKILQGLHKIIRGTLHRAKTALEPPQGLEDPGAAPAYQPYHPHLEERCSSLPCPSEDDLDLSGFGCWNPEFASMNLPSFRATYLFLCRVPRDIMHECLIIRLEQKPLEPSELSIRQLMRECKEALKLAVGERQKYISRVKAGIHDVELDKSFLENFDREMQEYDEHLTETLDVYLEYLRNFVTMIQGDSSLLISTYQKNLLEQEWDFIKSTCPHVPGGEARAGNTFCQMARGMLSAIEDFLQSGIDETMKNMYVLADSFTEDDEVELDTQTRKRLLEAFRGFQTLFSEARERSVKAISFAKLLRKDLEVSAEFSLSRSTEDVLSRLHHTGHVQVIAPHSRQHLIFIPNSIKNKEDHILQLLDMHCGQDTTNQDINHGYLVLMEHGISDVPLWHGETKFVKPTAETTISLSQIEVSGVLLVAPSAVLLEVRRKEFSKSMHDVLIPGQEQRATSQAIADSLDDVKQGALSLRSKICQELSSVEEKCDTSSLESLEPMDRDTLVRRMREILQQCYKFGFEYHKELDRLITGDNSRRDLAVGTIQFSMQWMRFVLAWCERGRGLRPDWAVKGMEFLYLAASPTYTRYLTECEFLDFKNLTEECHNHVVGDVRETPERKPSVSPRGDRGSRPYSRSGSRCASPHRSMSREDQLHRKLNEIDPDRIAMPPPQSPISPIPQSPMGTIRRRRSEGRRSLQGDELDASDLSVRVPAFGNLPWRERVKKSIECFESEREEQKHQQQVIGRVLDQTMPEDRIHIKARLVKFSWQRGVKIGQGHFGKVYTAINNETGDIMAMKEIPLQPNDHKTLKSVADELRIFESIHHPNLVNHFGVEIHREEMLIFMEYCPEGTLEALCSSTEAGLEESLVRRYTGQLLQAVACLHENGIVHRDIKGANIFLTDDMRNLKLGDFGCAVKIKAHTTMPGELQGFVGTQAFMAPEVFTRNMSEGHGRAADIWSLGCVVIEMVTGLRPWAELESNYQIMFKVGMGQTPGIPSTLSDEGKNFLARCFVHDPLKRDTAEDLINHHFTKIYEDDDVASMPLFASVSDMSEMRKSLVRKDSGKY